LISSTIRFASFLHFSPFYSPLVPLERLRLSLAGDERHATTGGNVAAGWAFPGVESIVIAYYMRGPGERMGDPWSGAS
jgi:hypothetical protein